MGGKPIRLEMVLPVSQTQTTFWVPQDGLYCSGVGVGLLRVSVGFSEMAITAVVGVDGERHCKPIVTGLAPNVCVDFWLFGWVRPWRVSILQRFSETPFIKSVGVPSNVRISAISVSVPVIPITMGLSKAVAPESPASVLAGAQAILPVYVLISVVINGTKTIQVSIFFGEI